ncbi:MAG: hypothetical protein PUJ82_04070 [Spirochaetales bacterium]|nr:hypothetical protein [Spirochaetales bacterium]
MIQITMIYILTYLIFKRRQTQFIKIHDSITFFSCFTFLQDPLFSTLGFVAAITGITMMIYLMRYKTEIL